MLHVGHVSIYLVCSIRELKGLPMTQSATADSCFEIRFEPHPFITLQQANDVAAPRHTGGMHGRGGAYRP